MFQNITHTAEDPFPRKIWINGKNKNERKTQYPSNLRKFLPLFVTEYIQRTMKLREIEM